MVKCTLPVASAAAQFVSKVVQSKDTPIALDSSASIYSDTNLMHYATVETEHPYKQATVAYFKVRELCNRKVDVVTISSSTQPRCVSGCTGYMLCVSGCTGYML